MFAFLLLFLLINSVSCGQDKTIEDCVKNVKKIGRGNGGDKKRPTVDPGLCHDLDSNSCRLFSLRQPQNHVTNRINDP